MTRQSLCNSNGRSAGSGGGPRLFGVRSAHESLRRTAATRTLSLHRCSTGSRSSEINDGATGRSLVLGQKVGWTQQEHRQFLMGLEDLGRGNWRGISTGYVPTKSPAQVASHAQKYFLHLSHTNQPVRRIRRSHFDLPTNMETGSSQQQQLNIPSEEVGSNEILGEAGTSEHPSPVVPEEPLQDLAGMSQLKIR